MFTESFAGTAGRDGRWVRMWRQSAGSEGLEPVLKHKMEAHRAVRTKMIGRIRRGMTQGNFNMYGDGIYTLLQVHVERRYRNFQISSIILLSQSEYLIGTVFMHPRERATLH